MTAIVVPPLTRQPAVGLYHQLGDDAARQGGADFDFTQGSLGPSGKIGFTRASSGTFFDNGGTMQLAASDTPRFDSGGPGNTSLLGLLIEGARTNAIRNSMMVGAVAGTPGTGPTNWSLANGGTVLSVVGSGVESGMTYIDVRYNGTTNTTFTTLEFDAQNVIIAATGQDWCSSFYIRRVAGSNANISSFANAVVERDVSGNFVGQGVTSFTLTTAYQRVIQQRTFSGGVTVARTNSYFGLVFSSGVAIDLTVRIACPQLELGTFASSFIPTTTTAATRAADIATISNLASIGYNALAGTVVTGFQLEGIAATAQRAVDMTDGTAANVHALTAYNSGVARAGSTVASAAQSDISAGSTVAATNYKLAYAYAANDFAACLNGGTVGTDTSGTVPTATDLRLGRSVTAARELFGWLRSLSYYPTRLSNPQLQAATS